MTASLFRSHWSSRSILFLDGQPSACDSFVLAIRVSPAAHRVRDERENTVETVETDD